MRRSSIGGPVTLWGTGSPRREFLHVDDAAAATLHLLRVYDSAETINVGTGEDVSIKELARIISEVVGYTGEVLWDTTKPDGTPRKLLDVTRLRDLGWSPEHRPGRGDHGDLSDLPHLPGLLGPAVGMRMVHE